MHVRVSIARTATSASLPRLLVIAASILISSCSRSPLDPIRDRHLEKTVLSFHRNDRLRAIEIDSTAQLEPIEGFCVLSAYEDRVTPDSDKTAPVNRILEHHQLAGSEAYWHLIVKSTGGIKIAVFKSADIQLGSPRPAFNGGSCAVVKSIRLEKLSTSPVKHSASQDYPKSKPDLDIQPATTADGL